MGQSNSHRFHSEEDTLVSSSTRGQDNNLYRSRSSRSFADLTSNPFRSAFRRIRKFFSRRVHEDTESYELQNIQSNMATPQDTLEEAFEAQTIDDVETGKDAIETIQVQEVSSSSGEEMNQVLLSPIPEVVTPSEELDFKNQYMDFAILKDKTTIEWVKQNRVVLVMRGLPGSGKSTLVDSLMRLYQDQDPVVCSADHYFVGDDGIYRFNAKKLKDAHEASHRMMQFASQEGKRLIIVDNTNVKHWEMKSYFQAACKSNFAYRLVIVEPKTPWRLDPVELAARNSHSVDERVLRNKVAQYSVVLPMYFAWFLSPTDSQMLVQVATKWVKKCFEGCEEFQESFKQFSSMLNSKSAASGYYSRDMCVSGDRTVLHCTAKFCGFGSDYADAEQYVSQQTVIDQFGKVEPIKVIGFVFTKDTLGARIELSESQLKLYDQNEDLRSAEKQYGKGPKPKTAAKRAVNSAAAAKVDENVQQSTLHSDKLDTSGINRFSPITGKGRRAHITVGTAEGVKPVTTGVDLLEAVTAEQTNQFITSFKFPGSQAVLRQYKEDLWVLYPGSYMTFQAMFTGHY